ncbi:alpha-ketoacid dehydrogenase subunit beta [Candidatus Woesearchaeota archaeon]|nr:alpha-ketoacid dehydrogenase subunit beta [Candidatus Woesearchaeota archaeon]
MAKLNMVEAINLALKKEMERDPTVVILGEDVGKDGGVFRITDGLQAQFGEKRVFDTPLAENGIIGTAIGMAVNGLKPIAEIQFDGFMMSTIDQLLSHAGRIRNRSRGRYHVQLVLRMPYGGGVRALEHHSECPEPFTAPIPGVKTVIPSTPYDAKGLLTSAIRDRDPVVFFEPKKLYRSLKEEVPETDYAIPLGKAKVFKEGNDVTIITWGAEVHTALAAQQLVEGKADLEIIDLRTVSPIDMETVLSSVKKTGRVIVLHEAPRNCGVGAEVAARIAEAAMLHLEAPITRVTSYDIPTPLPKLEGFFIPDAKKIAMAVEKVVNF